MPAWRPCTPLAPRHLEPRWQAKQGGCRRSPPLASSTLPRLQRVTVFPSPCAPPTVRAVRRGLRRLPPRPRHLRQLLLFGVDQHHRRLMRHLVRRASDGGDGEGWGGGVGWGVLRCLSAWVRHPSLTAPKLSTSPRPALPQHRPPLHHLRPVQARPVQGALAGACW